MAADRDRAAAEIAGGFDLARTHEHFPDAVFLRRRQDEVAVVHAKRGHAVRCFGLQACERIFAVAICDGGYFARIELAVSVGIEIDGPPGEARFAKVADAVGDYIA